MKVKKHEQIFISYRRYNPDFPSRCDFAGRIRSELSARGYTIFQDQVSIHRGDFEIQLREAIKNASVFLLILHPGALLDRSTVTDRDWLFWEIGRAYEYNIPVIPLMSQYEGEKIDFPEDLPEHVKRVKNEESVRFFGQEIYLKAELEKLIRLMEIRPEKAVGVRKDRPGAYITSRARIPSDEITGREELLQQIEDHFEAGNDALFLCGMGGIGKTAISLQYARRHLRNTDFGYIRFQKNLMLTISALQFFGDNLRDMNAEEIFRDRMEKLCAYGERLTLIIDSFDPEACNADSLDDLIEQDCTDEVTNGDILNTLWENGVKVLITSRGYFLNGEEASFDWMEVRPLDEDKIWDLYDKICSRQEDLPKDHYKKINEIIRLSGRHTLFVSLIFHAIAQGGKEAFDRIWKAFDSGGKSEFDNIWVSLRYNSRNYGNLNEYINSMYDFRAIDDGLRNVLVQMSFLPSEGMDLSLFMQIGDKISNEAINRLAALRLLELTYDQRQVKSGEDVSFIAVPHISLHPIIQACVNEQLQPEDKATEPFLSNLCTWYSPYEMQENIDLDQVMAACLRAEEKTPVTFWKSKLAREAGEIQIRLGRPAEAILSLTRHRIYETRNLHKTFGSVDVTDAARHLGNAYCQAGDYKNALKWLDMARDQIQMYLEIDPLNYSVLYISVCNDLARLYLETEEPEKAFVNTRTALSVARKQNRSESREAELLLAESLELNALCLQSSRQPEEKVINAENNLQEALDIFLRRLSENHLYVARIYYALSDNALKQYQREKALDYMQKYLLVLRRILPEDHPELMGGYYKAAKLFGKLSDPKTGTEYLNKAVRIQERFLPDNPSEKARIFQKIGSMYLDCYCYPLAQKYILQCISIQESQKDLDSLIFSYSILGDIFSKQRISDKALIFYKKVQNLAESIRGFNTPFTAATYYNIARVYRDRGEYAEALTYYKKELFIEERVLGKDHPETAATYHGIAVIYFYQGEYEKALDYYEKALSIEERVLGKNHPNTAATYYGIADIYVYQGEYEKALDYYKKALFIEERVLGKDHPDTAATYHGIADIYAYQGEYEKALVYYEKALSIKERVLGKNHPGTAATYHNIAWLYDDRGEYEKALDYFKKALSIKERVLGKDHPDTAVTYNGIAQVYKDQGEYEMALDYYEKALSIKESVLGKGHPRTAATYNGIADIYVSQGKYEKAQEYYEKALSIRERVLGKDHPDTAYTYNGIADIYACQGEYEKALDYYEKALSIRERVLGEDHPKTKSVRKSIKEITDMSSNNSAG